MVDKTLEKNTIEPEVKYRHEPDNLNMTNSTTIIYNFAGANNARAADVILKIVPSQKNWAA